MQRSDVVESKDEVEENDDKGRAISTLKRMQRGASRMSVTPAESWSKKG